MNETWQRGVLFVAAAWNVVGGAGALVEAPTQPAWIAVIAWGAAYLGAAFAPASRKVVLLAGGAGKLAYLAACVVLFREGSMSATLLAASSFDLVFVALFAAIVFGPRSPAAAPERAPTAPSGWATLGE